MIRIDAFPDFIAVHVFFESVYIDANRSGIRFEQFAGKVNPAVLRESAARFSERRFAEEFGALAAIPGGSRTAMYNSYHNRDTENENG